MWRNRGPLLRQEQLHGEGDEDGHPAQHGSDDELPGADVAARYRRRVTFPGLVERARARNPLPSGAVTVGFGVGVAGLTIYVFLAIAARTLGAERYAALSTMWSITFLAAPGFYFPLEQEVGRALAHRRARGLGGAPVVKRAAVLAAGFVGALTLLALAFSGILLEDFFDEEILLLVGFIMALAAYALQHLTRGTLSANSRYAPYGFLVGAEGVIRMTCCLVLAAAGIATAGPYGLVVGLSPILAVALVAPKAVDVLEPGPEANWRELSRALGYLLIGSVLAQAMINIAPLVVNVLADEADRTLVGKVLIALIISRVPVFFFQAIQASLIPQLAAFAADNRWHEFRTSLARLLAAVGAIAGIFTAFIAAVGPWVVRTFFGAEYELASADMAYMAAASGLFMLALALAQALISIAGYRRAALGWVVGMATLFVVTTIPGDLLFRVERGFLAGAAAAIVSMGLLLARPLQLGRTIGEVEFSGPQTMEP